MANRKRPHFAGLWLSDAGKKALEDLAKRENLGKSETLRLALAYASRRMPQGWRS